MQIYYKIYNYYINKKFEKYQKLKYNLLSKKLL